MVSDFGPQRKIPTIANVPGAVGLMGEGNGKSVETQRPYIKETVHSTLSL